MQPSGAWVGGQWDPDVSATGSVSILTIPPVNSSQEMNHSSCLPAKSYSDIETCSLLLPPVLLKIVHRPLMQVPSPLWDWVISLLWIRHGKALGSRDLTLNMIRMTFTQSPWWEVLDWMSLGSDRSAPCLFFFFCWNASCYFRCDVCDSEWTMMWLNHCSLLRNVYRFEWQCCSCVCVCARAHSLQVSSAAWEGFWSRWDPWWEVLGVSQSLTPYSPH